MVSIFKKSQNRNKRASRTEGIIRLLLIILWAVVIVVLGFYSGLGLSPPLAWRPGNTKHKQAVGTYPARYHFVAFVWRFGIDSNKASMG